jgi:hypothetical protein
MDVRLKAGLCHSSRQSGHGTRKVSVLENGGFMQKDTAGISAVCRYTLRLTHFPKNGTNRQNVMDMRVKAGLCHLS